MPEADLRTAARNASRKSYPSTNAQGLHKQVAAWNLLRECRRASAWRSITHAWRALLFPHHGIAIKNSDSSAYIVLKATRFVRKYVYPAEVFWKAGYPKDPSRATVAASRHRTYNTRGVTSEAACLHVCRWLWKQHTMRTNVPCPWDFTGACSRGAPCGLLRSSPARGRVGGG